MSTGRDLITGSLKLLGVIASGETPSADEATDGLSALNLLIDSISNEKLFIYEYKEESAITLVAGTGSYTLGEGGDITTRPQKIQKALIRDDSASPAFDHPVHILSLDEWARIAHKTLQTSLPTALYDDGGYPQRTVKLYPVPSEAKKLVLFTLRPLTQVSTLDTELSLPPGYERMLKFNLALDLAPEYGRQVDAMVLKAAQESREVVKRSNYRPTYLRVDAALQPRSEFNIFTGGSDR